MAIGDDILIDYINKRIYANAAFVPGTNTKYNSRALYTHIMDTFDELNQMDDQVPMSAQTPNAFTLINQWFMSQQVAEWLDNGAIATSGWENHIHKITLAAGGYVSCVAGDIGKMVNDDAVDFGILLDYNNATREWWIRRDSAVGSANLSAITIDSGTGAGTQSGVSSTGENLWANIYTLGTIHDESSVRIYVVQAGAKVQNFARSQNYYWALGHIDILLLVKEMGAEIDSGQVTVFLRNYPSAGGAGNVSLYDHFPIDLTSGGRNAVPLATASDLNNDSSRADVKALADTNIGGDLATGINVVFGSINRDLNNGNGSKTYYVDIDCNNQRLVDVYEVLKWVTREDSVTQLTTDAGDVDGFRYTTYDPSAWTPSKQSPFGTFAGGTFFGARGVWLSNVNSLDIKAYQLTASDDSTQNPPNTVSVTVSGVVSGDRVGVFRLDGVGGNVNKAMFGGVDAITSNTIVVVNNIDSDTPQAGYLRIRDAGDLSKEILFTYTSWASKTFSGVSPDPTGGTPFTPVSGDPIYAPLIDAQAGSTSVYNTLIYSSSIPVLVRVRKKGIIPFEVENSVGSNGMSQAAIRTTDGIVL
jgi:hypothetical protein